MKDMRATTIILGAACLAAACLAAWLTAAVGSSARRSGGPAPVAVCAAEGSRDQDDMCIWVHPTDRTKSTVITADNVDEFLTE